MGRSRSGDRGGGGEEGRRRRRRSSREDRRPSTRRKRSSHRRRSSSQSRSDGDVERLLRKERRQNKQSNGRRSGTPTQKNIDIDTDQQGSSTGGGIIFPGTLSTEVSVNVDGRLETNRLTDAVRQWLDERVHEQVSKRVAELETLVQERVLKARTDLEIRLRAQIELELKHELDTCHQREIESKSRCDELERQLKQRMTELEESEKRLKEERLDMLDVKSKLEMERSELARERDALTKSEQQQILNKGGAMRAPIKLKFGK